MALCSWKTPVAVFLSRNGLQASMFCLGRIHPPSSGDGVQFCLYWIPYKPDHVSRFSGDKILGLLSMI